jgi:hypothetical protein
MKNEQRSGLPETIAGLCQRYPNWRLGQLLANVAGWADQEIWDEEDEQLLAAAQLHLQKIATSTAAEEKNGQEVVTVPDELLPAIRQLLATHKTA